MRILKVAPGQDPCLLDIKNHHVQGTLEAIVGRNPVIAPMGSDFAAVVYDFDQRRQGASCTFRGAQLYGTVAIIGFRDQKVQGLTKEQIETYKHLFGGAKDE